MKKGSVTVLLALTIPLVLILLFTVIESARVSGCKALSVEAAETATQSILARYNQTLFDEYGILAFDGGFCKGMLEATELEELYEDYLWGNLPNGNQWEGGSILPVGVTQVRLTETETLTDGNGQAFIDAALKAAPTEIAEGLLEELKNRLGVFEFGDAKAKEAVADKEELFSTDWESVARENESREENAENPLNGKKLKKDLEETVISAGDNLKENGWFDWILPEGQAVSGNRISMNNRPSRMADNQSGSPSFPDEAKKYLYQEYLLSVFSDYQEPKKRALQYEIEYLLGGEDSDADNLKKVTQKIVAIREAVNIVALLMSEQYQNVHTMITGALAWTGIPLIGELVSVSVAAAWAYAESLADTRALLAGKKVAFRKSEGTWTVSYENLPQILSGQRVETKESEIGITYEDYLRILLWTADEREVSLRALDLIQVEMQKISPEFLIVASITKFTTRTDFSAREMFTLFPIVRRKRNYLYQYEWSRESAGTYQ